MHRESCACSKSELDLFAMPPTMMTMQESQWVEFNPVSSLTDAASIKFEINGQPEDHLDLNSSYLYLKVKLLYKTGGSVDSDGNVAPINSFTHSLFSEVDMYLNKKNSSAATYLPLPCLPGKSFNDGTDPKNTRIG